MSESRRGEEGAETRKRSIVRQRLHAQGENPDHHPEIVEEIVAHLDDVHRGAKARGLGDAAADAAWLAELDDLGSLTKALHRRRRTVFAADAPTPRTRFAHLGGDIRLAFRSMRTRPSYSAVVVLTLAVGIGACTTVFSLFNAVLLKSLPYPDADRLVLAWESDKATPTRQFIVAAPVYEDWARMNTTLASIGIWEYLTFNVAAGAEPEQRQGLRASPSLFAVLGVAPAIGRVFTDEEDRTAAKVAVISDGVWQSQFARDPQIAGKTMRLNGQTYEVIGVMPPTFEFPRRGFGVWIPMSFADRDRHRDSHSFFVAGRLRDGASVADANADFGRIGATLATSYPENEDETSVVTAMPEFGLTRLRTMLSTLLGAVALVLLIACVNVANLQIGHGLARRREFVVRIALGARLRRLARQLLIEASALALVGGLGGVAIAWFGTRSVDALLGRGFLDLPMRGAVIASIDAPVLLFTLAVSMTCALLFGLAPLAGIRRAQPQSLLLGGTRGVTRSGMTTRRLLVAVEVALALVVLCGAGLLLKSLASLLRVDAGLDPDRVLAMQVSLPQAAPYGPAERAAFCSDLDRSIASAPGLFTSHGATSHLPLSGANAGRGFVIDGRPAPENQGSGNYRITCPGYFGTLGIPLLEGRDFSPSDRRGAAAVVIVNKVIADRYFPKASAVGQRIRLTVDEAPWLTIVGVAGNVRHFGLESAPQREIYVPYGQASWPVMNIVVKSRAEISTASRDALRETLRRIDPALPAASILSMTTVVDGSMTWLTSFLRLLGVFAVIGLALAGIGVYSVLGYYVSQRSRELGVRVALGAPRRSIISLVLRQSLWPVVAGIVTGLIGSYWSNRLISGSLFGVTPTDPGVMTAIAVVLLVIGLAASVAPASRAARVDPIRALRDD